MNKTPMKMQAATESGSGNCGFGEVRGDLPKKIHHLEAAHGAARGASMASNRCAVGPRCGAAARWQPWWISLAVFAGPLARRRKRSKARLKTAARQPCRARSLHNNPWQPRHVPAAKTLRVLELVSYASAWPGPRWGRPVPAIARV